MVEVRGPGRGCRCRRGWSGCRPVAAGRGGGVGVAVGVAADRVVAPGGQGDRAGAVPLARSALDDEVRAAVALGLNEGARPEGERHAGGNGQRVAAAVRAPEPGARPGQRGARRGGTPNRTPLRPLPGPSCRRARPCRGGADDGDRVLATLVTVLPESVGMPAGEVTSMPSPRIGRRELVIGVMARGYTRCRRNERDVVELEGRVGVAVAGGTGLRGRPSHPPADRWRWRRRWCRRRSCRRARR